MRAVIAGLVLVLAACSSPGGEATAPNIDQVPDYDLDGLLAVLAQQGICEHPMIDADDREGPSGADAHAECLDAAAPGGLTVMVATSGTGRLSQLVGGLALGCGTNSEDANNEWSYVFGERWSIGPGYTLDPPDVAPTVDLMGTIAEITGGIVHTVTCPEIALRLNVAQDLGEDWVPEMSAAIMREPGYESDLLDQLDAAVAEVRSTIPDS